MVERKFHQMKQFAIHWLCLYATLNFLTIGSGIVFFPILHQAIALNNADWLSSDWTPRNIWKHVIWKQADVTLYFCFLRHICFLDSGIPC